jgi:hypothetical protein
MFPHLHHQFFQEHQPKLTHQDHMLACDCSSLHNEKLRNLGQVLILLDCMHSNFMNNFVQINNFPRLHFWQYLTILLMHTQLHICNNLQSFYKKRLLFHLSLLLSCIFLSLFILFPYINRIILSQSFSYIEQGHH